MKKKLCAGTTGHIERLFIQDTSQTDGRGLTALVYNTASLTVYYIRQGDASPTAITLVTATVGTWVSGGFVQIDATNMAGWYELHVPNAALAAGAKSVGIHLKGATNMAPYPIELELDAVNYQSATAFVTGINSLAPPTNWNLLTIDASGRMDLGKWLGAAPDALSSGKVPADLKLWLAAAPAALSTNGYVQGMLLRWLTDNAGGTPSALATNRVQSVDPNSANLDAAVSSRSTHAAADVWAVGTRTLSSFGTLVADVATAVWAAGARTLTAISDSSGITTLLTRITGAVLLASGYTAPDNTGIGVAAGAAVSAASNSATAASEAAGANTKAGQIKAKTDNLPAAPAAAGDIPTAVQIRQELDSNSVDLDAIGVAVGTLLTRVPATVASAATVAAIKAVTDVLAPLIESGAFTEAALANAPGSTTTPEGIRNTVWGNDDGLRTLTQPAAQLATIDAAGTVTVTRGVTVAIPFVDVPNLADRDRLWLTVKKRLAEADSEAVLQLEETAGLLYQNGAEADAGDGVLEVTGPTSVTATLSLAASALLPIGQGFYYDLKVRTAAGVIPAPAQGRMHIVSAVTRAVE